MSIPQVDNFDESKIPKEGSSTFRADASYVWDKIVDVIKSFNTAASKINSVSNTVSSNADIATDAKNDAITARSGAISAKDTAISAKNDAISAKDKSQSILDKINSYGLNDDEISDMKDLSSRVDGFDERITDNKRGLLRLKMQSFGIGLNPTL